ncbi:carboxymuconolactone decarboxylase family protein [Actinoplanes sp. NPDC000266]
MTRARIAPAGEPLDTDVQAAIDGVMRGRPPLALFTTLARDRRLFFKFFSGGLLDRGHLTLRQREIVIDRTTALCGAEYEWGVHVTTFAGPAELTSAQITSLTHGKAEDSCWTDEERALIDLCDALHTKATVDDHLWNRLRDHYGDGAILELLLLAGFYHTTSYVVNALALPLEPGMARFDQNEG